MIISTTPARVARRRAVVTVPVFGIFGPVAERWVGAGHLLIGYTVLGVILALRPRGRSRIVDRGRFW